MERGPHGVELAPGMDVHVSGDALVAAPNRDYQVAQIAADLFKAEGANIWCSDDMEMRIKAFVGVARIIVNAAYGD